ncbi:T3SS effector HopA1 family protein [Knoellia sp. LjRoot47]|uniref:T3SS effector HopA1 family protein n=1 Tax=Knoellia sp. LjRoot47 TaxID=3342330 RepID=UPI003ECC8B41
MNAWRPEHAAQVLTAYDVLRSSPADASPADVLYRGWYAVRPPRAGAPPRWAAPVAGTARAAHEAAVRWSVDDTEVVATGIAGVAVVATATGRRALCRGEYVTTQGRPGFPPRVGDRVRVLERPGSVIQEGWWRTWGGRWDHGAVPEELVRVYLRPDQGEVGRVVHAVTSALAEADEWLLKVATTTEELERPDACVVYLAGPRREAHRDLVVTAVAGLTAGDPPPLTERLAEGVGWAQDPGDGRSFGEGRCEAVATAYGRLDGTGAGTSAWLDLVAEEMSRSGVDPSSPHLGSEGGR